MPPLSRRTGAIDDRIDRTDEAYLSNFRFGNEFRYDMDRTGSSKGYSGIVGGSVLWWDIDREDDLEQALRDLRSG